MVFLVGLFVILPISMRLTPFFAMRTERADLSRVSKRKDFHDFPPDDGFGYAAVTVQIYVFTQRRIRYIRNLFEILRDWNIA